MSALLYQGREIQSNVMSENRMISENYKALAFVQAINNRVKNFM